MRIGVDVMGGDNAPDAILDGALASLERLDPSDEVVLYGDARIIDAGIRKLGPSRGAKVSRVATTEVVGMDESPVEAVLNKPDSSITVLCKQAGRKADEDRIVAGGGECRKVQRFPHATGAQF